MEKQNNLPKIILFIILILAIGIGGFFLIRKSAEEAPSEEQISDSERLVLNIITNLKKGYNTSYLGVELLYAEDKVTYEDLSTGNKIQTAINYINAYGLDTSIPSSTLEEIETNYNYKIDECTPYLGSTIRDAIKEVFNENFTDQSSIGEFNFGYDFIYIPEYDVYLMKANDNYKKSSDNKVKYLVTETKHSGSKLTITIAIAYVAKTDDTYSYSNTSTIDKVIFTSKTLDDLTEDQASSFDKYKITLEKNDDTYSFKSIEKVK